MPAGGSSHGGPIQKRPTTTPWWKLRQLSSQPSATSLSARTSKRSRSVRVPASSV
jgi:hypothetical protein